MLQLGPDLTSPGSVGEGLCRLVRPEDLPRLRPLVQGSPRVPNH